MNNKIKELRLAGWYAPLPEDELMKRYRDSGLDYLFLLRDDGYDCTHKEDTEKYLSLGDKYDIGIYVRRHSDYSLKEIRDMSDSYLKYKSFKGYCIYDEPRFDWLDRFSNELKEYEVTFKDYDFFINLFPDYAPPDFVGGKWQNYIKEYCEKILKNITRGDKWLSFDFYAICYSEQYKNYIAENWLKDTAIVADYAQQYGAYFNAFIQAMPFSGTETTRGSRDRFPSYNDICLQDYTNLAFGAKMLSYFCYDTPPVKSEFLRRHYAMIDRDSKVTPIYDAVKRANEEIRDFSSRYMEYERIGTYGLSPKKYYVFDRMKNPPLPKEITDRMELSFDGELLLGAFRKDDNLAIIPVNFGETTCNKRRDLVIMLKNKERIRISKRGKTREMEIKGNFVVSLDIGEGCFIEFLSQN